MFNEILFNWFPWSTVNLEIIVLQIFILYIYCLLIFSNNIYYFLFYFILEIFFLSLFLGYYNAEVFAAFLLVTECTVFFIILLFLFYLNFEGVFYKNNILFTLILFTLILFTLILFTFNNNLNLNYDIFNYYFLWDNFYEALNNNVMNDLNGLYLSYYFLNYILLIIIGFLIFIVTIICVSILKLIRYYLNQNNTIMFNLLNAYSISLNFLFLRIQNLFRQNFKTVNFKTLLSK